MSETDGSQPVSGGPRRIAKGLLWPARRFFDPSFVGIHEAMQDVQRLVEADMNAANEIATFTGRTLDQILERLEQQGRELAALRSGVDALEKFVGFDANAPNPVAHLDHRI